MKYLWFIGVSALFIRACLFAYLAIGGQIQDVHIQHKVAVIVVVIFLGYGVYLFYPNKKELK